MGSQQQIHVLVYCPFNASDNVLMMHSKSMCNTAKRESVSIQVAQQIIELFNDDASLQKKL
jgi:hypothetical protein